MGQAKYIPGPCNYETNTSTCLLHHSAKIGSERRSEMVLNNYTPGPGQYQDSKIHITLKR